MKASQIPAWVAIVVAVITASGVLTGALIQSRRDDKRWKRERMREDERWARERTREDERWAREERLKWFDLKVATSSAFLAQMREWRDHVYHKDFVTTEPKNLKTLAAETNSHILQLEWIASKEVCTLAVENWLLMAIASTIEEDPSDRLEEYIETVAKIRPSWVNLFQKVDSQEAFHRKLKEMIGTKEDQLKSAMRKEMLADEQRI